MFMNIVAGIMSLSLKVLQELLDTKDLQERLHIFVAHDDPHFVAGCYSKALGSLKERMVVGVRGADLQAPSSRNSPTELLKCMSGG